MMNMEKLNKIFEDDETAAAMSACTTMEEVLTVLKDKGIEITAEELKELIAAAAGMDKMGANNAVELDDDALAEVDGGINLSKARKRIWAALVWLVTPKNAFEYKPDFMPEPFDYNQEYGI